MAAAASSLRLTTPTTMARVIPGVKPRVKDANAFYQRGQQRMLNPMFAAVRARLAVVDSAPAAGAQLSFLRELDPDTAFAREALEEIDVYHYTRFSQTFRSALSVDVRPFLTRPEVSSLIDQHIVTNVRLIKTIPPRLHDSLIGRIQEEFRDSPFDRARLRTVLRDEFGSSGYNLRRLTRDQNNKLVGNLSEIRQRQVGVTRYRWRTVSDERVRDEHRDNNGRVFEWTNPPPLTGHPGQDIQCRCVALPVVDEIPDAGI